MENIFIPIIRQNESRLIAALREANMQAMQQIGMHFAVYIWSDGDITTLSYPHTKDGGYVEEAPCVLVGSFYYSHAVSHTAVSPQELEDKASEQNYVAILQNCIMILSHFH